jgi:hypothetical protein
MSEENNIQRQILEWLKLNHIEAWRNNTGRRGGVSYGKKGLPDIIGYLPDGRFLGIEVKSKNGKISKEQNEFIQRAKESSALCFVANDVVDVINNIRDYFSKV